MLTVADRLKGCMRVTAALVLTLLVAAPLRAQPSATPRRVVVLYDERTDLPGLAILDAGLVQSLTSGAAGSVEVYREAMDLSRLGSDTYLRLLRDYLRAKYAAKKIDVVVAAMGPSLDFLLSEGGDPVFPGTPIVFCGIDRREIERRALPGHVTGVLLKREFAPTLQVALRLHPDTTRVVFVGGTSEFDARLVEQARGEFRSYEERLAFTYLTRLPLPELLAALANLPPHTIVLYSTLFRDGAGEAFVPHEVAQRISAAANVPVYGFLDQFMGRGIVGGQLYSLDAHGKQAADLVRQVLAGKEPSELPLRDGGAGVDLFDWRQMKRWGISERQLPAGSRVLYRQLAAWELYRPHIIAGGVLVLLQGVFIAVLLIQRARRRHVERALRESEERFRLMADTAPVLVWRASPDKRCDFFNRPWLEFTGRTIEQELGNGWSEGVCPEDLDGCLRTYVSAFDARQPFRMEFRLRRADGAYRWVLDTGVPRYGSDGSFAGYIGSCLDITDRKASEDALRDNQQRYTMATAAGAVGVWDWNFGTGEIYVDPTLKAILGFDDSEITTRVDDWGSRVYAGDLAMVTARTQACIDGLVDEYEVEHRMLHKDGSVRWFLSRGSLLRRADGAPQRMVGTKVDITERRRAEEAIREQEAVLRMSEQEIQQLVGRLIAAQEAERSRIARDLHDDTSQQLAGLAIALSGLKRRMGAVQGNEDLQGDVASLQERTIALTENVRHLSHDLHPSVLEHSGLVTALTTYCRQVQGEQSVVVTFTTEGDFEPAGKQVALCLYRIAQEALRNVVAHAGARRADVRLRRTGDGAELTIADDGKGFDIARTGERSTGLGLVSINERARLVGGTVSITTELNKGTRVRVQIPAFPHTRTGPGGVAGRYAASA
jgi:PAS domain S-box-containing protein